jgi:glutamate--cysteine ligase
MDCLRTNVDALLTKVRKKYKEYGINEKPFVIVKADNGTYGMGIMTVRDVKDLDQLSRAPRTRWPWSRTARRCTTSSSRKGC